MGKQIILKEKNFTKLKEEVNETGEELEDNKATKNKELELFKNLVGITLDKEVEIKH